MNGETTINAAPVNRWVRLRQRINTLFDDDLPPNLAAKIFNLTLAVLIVINVSAVIVASVAPMRHRYFAWFRPIEQFSTVYFAIEYVLRLWTSVDQSSGKYRDPVRGRLLYAVQFFSLIDLVAVLPSILLTLGTTNFRVLRLLRLLRMLKLTRHSTAFGLLWAVVRDEAQTLGAVLFMLILVLIMSASIMFTIEGPVQPTVFSSIPAAMWWAIVTLTTVGYGDMVPVTAGGRILGGCVSVIGIGTLALFSGIVTASFMDQLRLRREHYRSAVSAGTATHQLDPDEIRAIARLGDRLGLPQGDIDNILSDPITSHGQHLTCPNCGHSVDRPNLNG